LIVLIIPPVVRKYDDRRLQPLGIAYLAAVLGEAGINCDMVDGNCSVPPSSVESIVSRVIEENYEIVGLSVTTDAFQTAVQIAEEVKRQKQVFVVFGGHHPTAMHKEILSDYDCVDVVVRGEGEISFLQLVRAKQEGRSLAGIQGISYRKAKGLVVVNPDRPPIEDLDSLPLPNRMGLRPLTEYARFYDPWDMRRKITASISSSRGCPCSCNFCVVHSFYGKGRPRWRARSLASIQREATELAGARDCPEHVFFTDDNFFVNVNRACESLEAAREIMPGLTFSFAARADQIVKAADKLGLLAKHGCRSVEVGVESGSDRSLKRMEKGTSVATNVKAIDLLKANGIFVNLDFIMFDPDSEIEDLEANVAFLKEKGFWGHFPPPLYDRIFLYPGSKILKQLQREGRVYGSKHNPSYRFSDLTVERVFNKVRMFRSRFQDALNQVVLSLDEARFSKIAGERIRSLGTLADMLVQSARAKLLPYKAFEAILADERSQDGSETTTCAFEQASRVIKELQSLLEL
jgi:anaerobic magnesium-protoporphyrin IX monomethyl ester cyclase